MPGIGTRFGTRGLSIGPHRGRSTTTTECSAPRGLHARTLWGGAVVPYWETAAGSTSRGSVGQHRRTLAGTCEVRRSVTDRRQRAYFKMRIVTHPQARRHRLRQIFSVYTAVVIAAAWYGYHLGGHVPEALANSLSAGLTVGAIVYAVGFALTQRVRRSISPTEMLNRDREIVRHGISTLRRAMVVTLLVLTYIGLSGTLSTDSQVTLLFAAASSSSLAWLLYSIPRTFQRHVYYISGLDDEHPDLDGMWKSPRRFRRETIEVLIQTTDGWRVNGRNPFMTQEAGPAFVSKEIAIRFGALQAEACLHYVQLCDRPEQAEAADRVQRIMFCLDEMERLRNLEQQIRCCQVIPNLVGR